LSSKEWGEKDKIEREKGDMNTAMIGRLAKKRVKNQLKLSDRNKTTNEGENSNTSAK